MAKKKYQSYQELVDQNKGLFKFFSKSKSTGLLKAIWQSRDPEVSELKKIVEEQNLKLLELSRLQEIEVEYKKLLISEKTLQEEKDELKDIIYDMEHEREKLQRFIKNVNSAMNMTHSQKEKLKEDTELLKGQINLAKMTVKKLDEEYWKTSEELSTTQIRLEEVEKKYDEGIRYSKQYRKINQELSAELEKIQNELKKWQKLAQNPDLAPPSSRFNFFENQ